MPMTATCFHLPQDHLDAVRAIADSRGTNVSIELRRAVRTLAASEGRRTVTP